MIQILGLRDYFDSKTGKTKKKHAFFNEGWKAPSVVALFKDPAKYLEQIPESEHWNMYFTVANCHGKSPRDFHFQTVLPIDIDHINVDMMEVTARTACEAIGVNYDFTGVLFSGNGLQLFVMLDETIQDRGFFESERVFYKGMCKQINQALRAKSLPGDTDPSVFSDARLMRMPETLNKKPGKPERKARVLQSHIEPQNFNLRVASGIPSVQTIDQINPDALKTYKLDSESVLSGCAFLSYCKDNPEQVSEPQWYAMLGVLGYLKNGTDLAHEYSKGSKDYTSEETNEKLEQAKVSSGPRTCKSIDNLWGGCKNCKFYNKQKSPVLIKGDDYIATRDTGFYNILQGANGAIKRVPNYSDLLKFFKKKYTYMYNLEEEILYEYVDGYWRPMQEQVVRIFAEKNFNPAPQESMRSEFLAKVKVNNPKTKEEIEESISGKINLKNCVYDIQTREIFEHSPDFYFKSKTNFEYDKSADCPMFDAFLQEVLEGDEDKIRALKEFGGYGLSGEDPKFEKLAILIGDGANGKSVFLDILRGLFVENTVGGYSLEEIASEDYARYEVFDKPMNICEESDGRINLKTSSVLKNITTGGHLKVRTPYGRPFSPKWRAKIIVAMNNMPAILDRSGGSKRRYMFINFDYIVPKGKRDPYLAEKILLAEAPGIFNCFMDAYTDLKNRGYFIVPSSSDDTLNDSIKDNDPMAQWIEYNLAITKDQEDFSASDDLFDDYLKYIRENNIKGSYTKRKFLTEISKRLKLDYNLPKIKKRDDGLRQTGYQGVKINNVPKF